MTAYDSTDGTRTGLALHTRMLIGFAVGVVAGLAANMLVGEAAWLDVLVTYVADPIGQLFLRLLFMVVIPLVFSALVLGVVEIGDPRSLGRIGGKTLLWILVVTAMAVTIGLVLVNLLQPGQGLPPDIAQTLLSESSARATEIAGGREAVSGIDVLLNIVPRNPVAAATDGDLIAVMFFALMFGIAATVLQSEGTKTFVGTVQGIYDICLKIIGWVIELAPYAVAALLFSITAQLGLDVLVQLARFVGTVLLALAIHFFVVFPTLLWVFGGMSPMRFFRGAQPALLTAFSTSSSSATLPTTLKVSVEELGVPRRVARFVCTLGATANMNGTALFEGITVLFLAQFFGVELGLLQQGLILVMCILGSVGAAGVPGGSLPVIAMILVMFGIPPEGIGLILGVDRFLDMCRTVVNVGGDMAGSVVIGRSEEGAGAAPVAPRTDA
ncbi:dicarboxylate/amino acid:cation symporter [Novilysobacter spongiicola]|uniref:Dicarboxylate/amino acid:cation (Na+ or H+) symporter, DAACS family n=2 Tax=Novilysobacter TaxID=3382699 RepID=A0A1T4RQB0_9GAMM|nr:dicarboxylate/amino acid:cation symporter [Lysobacter spongiicola]SKA18190.1 dicarboxylate/amino acid:cation (Na+ or H+) symporter, DAACS family [Lysobacter spongiicola DSM 21749]